MDVLERIARGNKLLNDAQIIIHGDIEELIRLAKLGKRMQWVSVLDAEKLPPIGKNVLVLASNGDVIKAKRVHFGYENRWRKWVDNKEYEVIVTHHMPIPPNPGEVE